MDIIVCIKQVPETKDVEVDEETGVLKREGADSQMNPFDLYALETAFRIRESLGGRVSVLSMGPSSATEIIEEAYAMGADAGYLLSDRRFAGADTLATSFTLAQGVRKIGRFDLILCGKQTTDGDTGQVGPGLAEFLQIPHVSYAREIERVTDTTIVVQKDMAATYEQMEMELPGLVTVTKDVGQPRLPSFRLKRETRDRGVTMWSLDDLEVSGDDAHFGLDGSPTQVERIFPPERKAEKVMWRGEGEELAERLHTTLRDLKFL